ncbi:MAG: DUF3990 domain-containing protein [Tannerellaceae bacterium]|jgi:hypothetical protein|nr:DUF3990 domain-containing protein [Tannerellaceae bacterium]
MMIKVYHGSTIKVRKIDLSKSENLRDFGRGFYTTTIREHAIAWARRQALRRKANPILTEFDFLVDAFDIEDFKTLRFDKPSREWVEFVLLNRDPNETHPAHDYDIVEGPIADDWVTNKIILYEEGKITKENLIKALTYREVSHQIAFCTRLSLQTIEHVEHDFKWDILEITEAIGYALVQRGMDLREAEKFLLQSEAFARLADEASGLCLLPWTETFGLLLKELPPGT